MSASPFSALGADAKFQPEAALLDRLVAEAALGPDQRAAITARACSASTVSSRSVFSMISSGR